jgi:hypothetical protein
MVEAIRPARQACRHCASAVALVAGAHSREPFAPSHKRLAFAAGNDAARHRALLAFSLVDEGWIDATPVFPRMS